MLQDIERIEVIRGAGGAVWGANAVNGVINIVTKSAADTKGTMVSLSAGTFDRDQALVRHGGSVGAVAYRLYSQWTDHGNLRDDTGRSAEDHWNSLTNGARIDWTHGADAIMALATFTTGDSRPHWKQIFPPSSGLPPSSAGISEVRSGTAMARWTHTQANGSLFQVQTFKTNRLRDETTLRGEERIHDLEFQYRTKLGGRHDVVLGGGYRDDVFTTRPTFATDIASSDNDIFNAFLEDEINLGTSLRVILGSKLEHDNLAGWGLLPSARIIWNVSPNTQRVWAAVSRARRTPSAAERGLRVYVAAIPSEAAIPLIFGIVGNPDFRTEHVTEVEGGYRFQIGASAGIDIALFRGRYDHLSTQEPIAPSFHALPEPHVLLANQYANLLNATTAGVEIAAHWAPTKVWRLDGSYSGLHVSPHADMASQDPVAPAFDGNAPQHQWQLHSAVWATPRLQVEASLYRVGRLRQIGAAAYTRTDARVEFKITDRVSAIGSGQNLFERRHAEFPSANLPVVSSAVPRGGSVSLLWIF